MTDKATLEVESPVSGVLLRIMVKEGETAPVATPIAVIGDPNEALPDAPRGPVAGRAEERHTDATAVRQAAAAAEPGSAFPERIKISPRARALAAAHGIDAASLTGTGPGGRVLERDVEQAVAARGTPAAAGPSAAAVPSSVVPAAGQQAGGPSGATQTPDRAAVVGSRMRAIIAKRMTESLRSTAQLTLTTEVEMAEAARLREEIRPELERRDHVQVTYTDLVVRATALALRDHPAMNAQWEGEGIRRLPDVHIGVAVALDEGLIVPVIRNADRATLSQISAAVRDLSDRARSQRIRAEEVQGSTFTITNLGTFEIDAFTPILNPPEAAILGVGRVHRKPVAVGERVAIEPTMVLSLTFDHRVVDGAPAAKFLQRVKEILEHPYLLLLP